MSAPFQHIACCLEHESNASKQSLDEARRLRALGPGRLTLVHVVAPPVVYPALPGSGVQTWHPDPTEFRESAMEWLLRVAVDGEETVVLDGPAAAAVCSWVATTDVDLLVAASHRGLLDRALLGSFAGYLGRHSPCAVLLVRPVTERMGPGVASAA